MKKLLFALLIAFVVSAIVQTEEKELEFNISKFIGSLTGNSLAVYTKLVSGGIWETFVSKVKQRKTVVAFNVCTGYTGQGPICNQLINGMTTMA